jgi:hypothetical protein
MGVVVNAFMIVCYENVKVFRRLLRCSALSFCRLGGWLHCFMSSVPLILSPSLQLYRAL